MTLRRAFKRELTTGRTALHQTAIAVQVDLMNQRKNLAAAGRASEFTLARQFGWSEKHVSENVNLNMNAEADPALLDKMAAFGCGA